MNRLKGYIERKGGEIVGIASTQDQDRDGEVIIQDGWDLVNFKANPVVMFGHSYGDFPIGKATDIRIEGDKLVFTAVFSEATQKAKEAYQLIKEGFLNTFSVGFIPRQYDPENNNIITKAELLEISVVPVPANPKAVVMAKNFKGKNELLTNLVKHWLIDQKQEEEEVQEEEKEPTKSELEKIEQEETEEKGTINYTTDDCTDGGTAWTINPEDLKNNSTTEVLKGEDKENGKDSAGSEIEDMDIKLLQKATGHLQKLLCELKKKGGAKLK